MNSYSLIGGSFILKKEFFMKAKRLSRRHSRKMFRKGASRIHKRNLQGGHYVMRGGIRL